MNVSKLPKWAQARITELEVRVAELEGIKKPEKIVRDLPPPKHFEKPELTKGWDFNDYRLLATNSCETAVFKACSSSVHHGTGWERTTSQAPAHLFSTEVLAWKGLRASLMKQFGEKVAFVDRKIRELGGAK